jgi:membrane protein YqaA with SNARE-associated domain
VLSDASEHSSVGPKSKRDRAKAAARRLADSRRAQPLLVWLSFLEATLVPIPLEAVLVPFMLLRREMVWRIAALALLGFIVASVLGYALGAIAFDTAGIWLIETAGWEDGLDRAQTLFDRYGFWALVLIGVTPVPAQLAMLLGGAFHYPLPWFVAAMGLSRAIRYFGLAALVVWLGPQVAKTLERLQSMPAGRRHATKAAIGLAVGLLIVLMVFILSR